MFLNVLKCKNWCNFIFVDLISIQRSSIWSPTWSVFVRNKLLTFQTHCHFLFGQDSVSLALIGILLAAVAFFLQSIRVKYKLVKCCINPELFIERYVLVKFCRKKFPLRVRAPCLYWPNPSHPPLTQLSADFCWQRRVTMRNYNLCEIS